MKIISITNQKGGVAKTTTTINLAAALVLLGKRCLVIDLDPQSQLTDGLGVSTEHKITGYNVIRDSVILTSGEKMEGGVPLREAIIETKWQGLDIVPGNIHMANAELTLAPLSTGRDTLLARAIKKAQLRDEYDYILFDTSPTLGILTVNAICAAHEIIVPIEPSKFSLDAIKDLSKTIVVYRETEVTKAVISGILLTRVPPSSRVKDDCLAQVEAEYGDLVFKTYISANEKVKESQSAQVPLVFYDHKAKAAMQYIELAKEMTENGR